MVWNVIYFLKDPEYSKYCASLITDYNNNGLGYSSSGSNEKPLALFNYLHH